MEKYIEWKPIKVVPEEVFLDQLSDSPNGLVIVLADRKGKRMTISFGVVSAYRNVMEEMRSSFWPSFHKNKHGSGPCWIVKDSAWLAEFSEADLFHNQNCTHYFIVTAEDCIDIITSQKPEVIVEATSSRIIA